MIRCEPQTQKMLTAARALFGKKVDGRLSQVEVKQPSVELRRHWVESAL